MSKTEVEKFVNGSLQDIQKSLPKGFRVDDKINFDIALVTKAKAKGGIDIKLASVGSDIESQTVHRIRFSVIDEEAQKKSWKMGKNVLTQFFSGLAALDNGQQSIEHKPKKRKVNNHGKKSR